MRIGLVLALAILASIGPAQLLDAPHGAPDRQRLPEIAPAPAFTLISRDGARVSLADLRGKVAAVTFIYTLCGDTCPVLTPMMALVADRLGRNFGRKVAFVSITIDPERDTPDMQWRRSSRLELPDRRSGCDQGPDAPLWRFCFEKP
jgi:protein SCO1/2